MEPVSRDLTFADDYNQLYLRSGAHRLPDDGNDYLDALAAATKAGLTVGVASGVVDVLMPRQWNFSAKLVFSLFTASPPLIEAADHAIEFDLTSSGQITLEGSGGSGKLEIEVPPGRYRARLSGFDLDAYDDAGDPTVHYRLELWPSVEPASPTAS